MKTNIFLTSLFLIVSSILFSGSQPNRIVCTEIDDTGTYVYECLESEDVCFYVEVGNLSVTCYGKKVKRPQDPHIDPNN